MKLKIVIHEAEEGGYWAEVPAIPGCVSQGETFDELLANIHEAVEGCLSVDVDDVVVSKNDRVPLDTVTVCHLSELADPVEVPSES